eukprot:Sspe_Gene.50545::Locus_28136_Transcript_1_1_Confidence_1.000_Length_4095::g.50545::m.50545
MSCWCSFCCWKMLGATRSHASRIFCWLSRRRWFSCSCFTSCRRRSSHLPYDSDKLSPSSSATSRCAAARSCTALLSSLASPESFRMISSSVFPSSKRFTKMRICSSCPLAISCCCSSSLHRTPKSFSTLYILFCRVHALRRCLSASCFAVSAMRQKACESSCRERMVARADRTSRRSSSSRRSPSSRSCRSSSRAFTAVRSASSTRPLSLSNRPLRASRAAPASVALSMYSLFSSFTLSICLRRSSRSSAFFFSTTAARSSRALLRRSASSSFDCSSPSSTVLKCSSCCSAARCAISDFSSFSCASDSNFFRLRISSFSASFLLAAVSCRSASTCCPSRISRRSRASFSSLNFTASSSHSFTFASSPVLCCFKLAFSASTALHFACSCAHRSSHCFSCPCSCSTVMSGASAPSSPIAPKGTLSRYD